MCRTGIRAGLGAMLVGCAPAPPAFPEAADETGTSATDAAATAAGDGLGDETTSAEHDTSTGEDSGETDVDPAATESGTGSGPGICGDGVPGSGEPCDDGNRSQIDGCTSSCEVGPVDLVRNGDPIASPILLYDDQMPPVTTNADCPEGQAVVGLDIGWPKGVGGITVRCGSLSLVDADPTAIEVGLGLALPPVGGWPGEDYVLACPAGEVLGELTADGSDNGGMFGLGGTCRVAVVSGVGGGQSLSIAQGSGLEFQGFGTPQDLTPCPDGTVATGVTVELLQSAWPVAIGLRCHALELSYP